jgi:hypothetical protein
MWHTGVSNLNFMMKAALKALFGGMPEASHEKAIECFLKADSCKVRQIKKRDCSAFDGLWR